jgi:hypothetical protein
VIERSGDDAPIAPESWAERVAAFGKPLMLGLALFAVTGAVVTWVAVTSLWILYGRIKRRRREDAP